MASARRVSRSGAGLGMTNVDSTNTIAAPTRLVATSRTVSSS